MWCAAPSNQCSRRTPPHWRETDASQRYRAPAAFHTGIRPTSKVDCQQQLCCVYDDRGGGSGFGARDCRQGRGSFSHGGGYSGGGGGYYGGGGGGGGHDWWGQ